MRGVDSESIPLEVLIKTAISGAIPGIAGRGPATSQHGGRAVVNLGPQCLTSWVCGCDERRVRLRGERGGELS